MNVFKLVGTYFLTISLTAGAVVYCHSAFAPRSIIETIEAIRAVTCMMAIETLKKEQAAKYCGNIINSK